MNTHLAQPLMSPETVDRLLNEIYPQLNDSRPTYRVTGILPGGCIVRLDADERHLRPGDTVSGPTLFTLADIGGFVCVLAHAGGNPLSVTTSLNLNFMRTAPGGVVEAHCRILKLGRTLMVYEADLLAGSDRIRVAHATGTYSLPPRYAQESAVS